VQRNAEDSVRMEVGAVRLLPCAVSKKARKSAGEDFSSKTTDLLEINKKALVLVATVSLLDW